jgi:hypothetical protein
MWYPTQLDGCSIVILRPPSGFRRHFEIVEKGVLSHDGETLTLASETGRAGRIVTEDELSRILTVGDGNMIPECEGFQLFILEQIPS